MKRILTNIESRKVAFSLMGLIASCSLYAYDLEENGISYSILPDRDHCVEVSAADPALNNIKIPDTVNISGSDYTVVSIGEEAFCFHHAQKLELPSTLEKISYLGLFTLCNVEYLKIPDNVSTMESGCVGDGFYYSIIIIA